MKVTPIASGGNHGTNLGAASIGRTADPTKLAAAKAIAAGETPIRVAESDTPVDSQVARAQESLRKIKMKTNRSPERYLEEAEEVAPVAEAAPVTEEVPPVTEPSATIGNNEEAEPAIEETKPLSPQLAALARERRAVQSERAQLAKEKAAYEASKDLSAYVPAADLKANPLSVLKAQGVTYDQLTEAILAEQNGIDPRVEELEAKIQALEKGIDTKLSDRDAEAENATFAEMQKEAFFLSKSDDTYEMVRETKSIPKVMDLLRRAWKERGEILDVSEAMQLVEDELLNDSVRLASTKKVQGRMKPQEAQGSAPQKQPQTPTKVMRTLTSRDNASTPLSPKARAVAAFHGTLKR